jgi:hypothetical protein
VLNCISSLKLSQVLLVIEVKCDRHQPRDRVWRDKLIEVTSVSFLPLLCLLLHKQPSNKLKDLVLISFILDGLELSRVPIKCFRQDSIPYLIRDARVIISIIHDVLSNGLVIGDTHHSIEELERNF